MSIQRPYNLNIAGQCFDAKEDIEVTWQVTGAIQRKFAIEIKDNFNDNTVFTLPQTNGYTSKYTIPADTLINGKEYKIYITVWDEYNNSAISSGDIFQCYSRPVVTLIPIVGDGVVRSQNYTFEASYSQTENIPIRYWNAYLYDSQQRLISESGLQTALPLQFVYERFESEKSYYIEFQATSNKGLIGTTGKILFDVEFARPAINGELKAEQYNYGGIKLSWRVAQIIGKTDCLSPKYIDNEKIDLKHCKAWFDEGFGVDKNFTIYLWIEEPLDSNERDIEGIVVSRFDPNNLNTIWIYDENQAVSRNLNMIKSSYQPTDTEKLWIDDIYQGKERDLYEIFTSRPKSYRVIWLDYEQQEEDYLLKMKGVNGEFILKYFNDRFHFYKIINGITTHVVSDIVMGSSKFFICLRQINDDIDCYTEVIY